MKVLPKLHISMYKYISNDFSMRICWNWQTGTFEGRVLYGVWVQVPLFAPIWMFLWDLTFHKNIFYCIGKLDFYLGII